MPVGTSSLTLLRPATLRDALDMMQEDPSLTPLAGCTDVYVNLHFGTAREKAYIDLWPLQELRGVSADGQGLRIGALTTYTELLASPLIHHRLPMLAAAAREVGGRQIQHRGTIGGNVANASPAGDTLPVLAAADASVVLTSATNERRVAFNSFFTGYRQTARRSDELITALEIPAVPGKQWWRKVGTRRAQAISKVMMAGVRGDRVRVALGSVGPTVARLRRTETALSDGASIEEARRVLEQEIAPIDDIRSTAAYRRRVSGNLLARFMADTQ